uniref:Uncharacterized protein n=1 Tax=Quercus lobata TaxID=97700 RepID=A0A7N2MJH7_QUELO
MKLAVLQLDANHLTGLLPQNLCHSSSLQNFTANRNRLRSPQLSTLRIAGNKISGGIPTEIGNSIQVYVPDLSFNRLVEKLPKEFGKLTSLLALMLNGNQISGDIPQDLGS